MKRLLDIVEAIICIVGSFVLIVAFNDSVKSFVADLFGIVIY